MSKYKRPTKDHDSFEVCFRQKKKVSRWRNAHQHASCPVSCRASAAVSFSLLLRIILIPCGTGLSIRLINIVIQCDNSHLLVKQIFSENLSQTIFICCMQITCLYYRLCVVTTEAKIGSSGQESVLYFTSLTSLWSSLALWDCSVSGTKYFLIGRIKIGKAECWIKMHIS